MLRFFRQIRQRLFSDNKFSKYLLYAVGEIFLVVIGILLALQINTWSRDREERMEEHQLLVRLEKELEEDLKNIEEVKNRSEVRIVLSLAVLDSLGENNGNYVRQWPYFDHALKTYSDYTGIDSRSMGECLFFILARNQFNPARITFDEILSGGKLSLFRNDSLRISLQEHYSKMNDLQMFEDRLISEVQKSYRDAMYSNEISTLSRDDSRTILGRLATPGQLKATLEIYIKVTMTLLNPLFYNQDSTYKRTLELIAMVRNQINSK